MTVVGDHFSGREGHEAASFGGFVWVLGGEDGGGSYGDVWRSGDGVGWELVATAGFSARSGHEVVMRDSPAFVYEAADVVAGAGGVLTVTVTAGSVAPLTVGTVTASGGVGGLRFEVAADVWGGATVGRRSGVLAVTVVPVQGGWATVSVLVRDATPVHAATVAVTVRFVAPLAVGRGSVGFVLSPDFVGAVFVPRVTGGEGRYAFERVGGATAVAVDARTGGVAVTVSMATGVTMAVFAVTDEDAGSVRFTVGLQVGEESEEGEMFVVGGYDGGRYLDGVWRLADGGRWVRLPAASGGRLKGTAAHQAVFYGGSLWVLGGEEEGVDKDRNDVWRSADGRGWALVTVSAAWAKRSDHQVVVFGGSLWVLGGSSNGGLSDVWRSGNGVDWDLVTVSAAWAGRWGHQAVVHDGSLWVLGGYGGRGLNDVWRSGNGSVWVSVTVAGGRFSERWGHQAVSYDGSLWVLGGYGGRGLNDVWRSADGGSWELVTVSAAWAGRFGHQAVVYDGDLWVVAGEGQDGDVDGRYKGDVWRSRDGERWVPASSEGLFPAVGGHQVVARDGQPPFVAEVAEVVAGAVGGTLTVGHGGVTPVTLATVTARGGVGGLRFEVAADVRGVATVGVRDGVLAVSVMPDREGLATVSILVRDATPVNSAMVAVTIRFVIPLMVGRSSVGYLVSPDFVGAVHSPAVTGGEGRYAFEKVTGPAAVVADARTGRVSVATAMAAGSRGMAVFAVRDAAGGSVRFTVGVQVRAVAALRGEELLVVGGHGAGLALPDDWGSMDGVGWVPVHSSGRAWHQAVSFGGSLWVLGGWDGGAVVNDVWRSIYGRAWTRVTVEGEHFSGRIWHQAVAFGGSLWVLGGRDAEGRYLADVWRSADGVGWEQVVVWADWSARRGHQAVVHGGSLWVIGGYDSAGRRLDDVWRSADGKRWVRVAVSGGHFLGREAHEAVSHGGSIWVLGGSAGSAVCEGGGSSGGDTCGYWVSDVWRSADGAVWVQATGDGGRFPPRGGHEAVSFGGSVWVFGGNGGASVALPVAVGGSLWVVGGDDENRYYGDVWRSADGVSWVRVTEEAFAGRGYHQVVVREGGAFAHEVGAVSVDAVGGVTVTIVGVLPPVVLATVMARGGRGGIRGRLLFDVAADSKGVAMVGVRDGVLVATNFIGERGGVATVSIRVRDVNLVNSATMAVTVVFDSPLRLPRSSVGVVVSPDFVGAVYSLVVRGGVGVYAFERVAGAEAIVVGERTGVAAIGERVPAGGDLTAVLAVRDEGGGSVRFTLGVRGDVAARGARLFVVGGHGSLDRGVWSSADGGGWSREEGVSGEDFPDLGGHRAVSYGGSVWVVGGHDGGGPLDVVRRSKDGRSWVSVAVVGGRFSRRSEHQVVAHDGSLWVLGGYDGIRCVPSFVCGGGGFRMGGDDVGLRNDVWRSRDGGAWVSVSVAGAHFSGRWGHEAVSYGGSLWVVGGMMGMVRWVMFGGRRMGWGGIWWGLRGRVFRDGFIIRWFLMMGAFGLWGGVMGMARWVMFGGRGMGWGGFR